MLMRNLAKIILLFVAHISSNPAWSTENADPGQRHFRPARMEEMIGVWSARAFSGSYYRYRYLAITRDGRIGWLVSHTAPTPLNGTAVIDAIDRGTVADGHVAKWRSFKANDGYLTEMNDDGRGTNYRVTLVVDGEREGYPAARRDCIVGDMDMQQIYQALFNADGSPIHIQAAPPFFLRRLAE